MRVCAWQFSTTAKGETKVCRVAVEDEGETEDKDKAKARYWAAGACHWAANDEAEAHRVEDKAEAEACRKVEAKACRETAITGWRRFGGYTMEEMWQRRRRPLSQRRPQRGPLRWCPTRPLRVPG